MARTHTYTYLRERDRQTDRLHDCVHLVQSVDVLEYNLTGLRPFTNYSIQVLVVTVIGSGQPGPPAFVLTEESGTHTWVAGSGSAGCSPTLPLPPLPSGNICRTFGAS